MFLDGLIQRKIASLLRPWLAEEPVWEVKLGLVRSLFVARKLRFDSSALNELIGAEFRLTVKEVTVEEVSVRVANWSSPALAVDIRGVHITLAAEERQDERNIRKKRKSAGSSLQEKKQLLAKIDPEGSAFHDNLEKLMISSSSESQLKTSFVNLILRKCCLTVDGMHIMMEFPSSDETFVLLGDILDLKAECRHVRHGCLLGDVISLLVLPLRDSSVEISARTLQIRSNWKNQDRCICSCIEPCIGIGLKDLCLLDFMFCAPEIVFQISPAELYVITKFDVLNPSDTSHRRNGQQLWKLARTRVCHTIFPRRYLLYQVMNSALLSLRLVKAYQYFLVLIGCHTEIPSHKMEIKMPRNGKFSKLAKEEWSIVCKFEEELPAEAIAWARRIARCKLMLGEAAEDNLMTPGTNHILYFNKIFLLLLVFWRTICKILEIFRAIFFLKHSADAGLTGDNIPEDYILLSRIRLNFGNISVLVHPADPIQFPSFYEQQSGSRISYSDICSFHLTIKGILFVCEEGVCEEYISLSLGLLQVASIPVLGGSGNAAGVTKNSTDHEEYWKQRSANSRDIAWGLPAPIFFLTEESESGSRLNNGGDDVPFREKRLGEVETAWRRLCSMFQKSDMLYSGYPFLFCDIKSFWVHPGLQNPGSGLCKCHLGVGKLNFAFRYSEVLSVAVVLSQMQHSFHELEYSGSNMVHTHPSWTDLHLQRLKHLGRSNFDIQKLKMTLFELLPEKSIELDVLIAGPHVRLLWREEEDADSNTYGESTHGQEGFDVMFDFHNIHLVVWPTSEPTNQKVNNMDMKNSRIEAGVDTTTGSDQVKYVSQGLLSLGYFFRFGGLNAYFEDPIEYQKMQVMLLKSITIELSTLRDYVYFFGAATAALSAASSCRMEGGFVFFYVDELSLILQDFQKLFSIATVYTVGNSYFNDGTGGPASAMNELPTVEPEIEARLHDVEGVLLRSVSSSFMITSTFQIEPFNIILHGSKSNNQGSSSLSPSSYHGLLELSPSGIWLSTCKIYGEISCMGDRAEVDVDLVGFRAALFKTNDIQSKLDQFEDESDVLLSLDCLYEASMSSCKVSLLLGCIEDLSSSEVAGAADRLACSSNIKSFMVNFSETSDNSSSTSFPEKEIGSSMPTLATANWLLINLTLDIIFVGSSSIKKSYASANPSTVFFSISDGGVFQILCLGIQDGHILVEPTVLSMFGWCLSSYFNCIGLSFSAEKAGIEHRTSAEPGGSMVVPGKHHTEGNEQQISCVDHPVSWENVEALTINLSQLSITLLSMHEKSVGVQKLTGTVDVCLSFWPQDGRRMVLFNMSLMQLLSKRDDANEEIKVKQNRIPCFSHGSSSYLSTKDADGDFTSSVSDHASCSFSDGPGEKSLTDDSLCHVINGSKEHTILKELSVLVSAQKLETGCDNRSCDFNQGWDGSGSLSGFDMTLSLLEIEMLMETVESFSEVFGEATSSDVKKKRLLSFHLKPESDTEASIPDGSIVAIQDVHQHMYITVVNEENDKFSLSSTIHYSLVGERALFRVKSQKQRRWKFRSSCYSLESLFAKNNKGEPLRLDYCSGSGFVGISSTSESAGALWKVVSYRPESSEEDSGLEPFSQLSRNTFHLINRKNDCGVALVDGTPEFVRKPGNQFKLKIFSGSGLACDIATSDTHPVRENGPNSDSLGVSAHKKFRVPCVWISMENAMLTIVHELSDNNNKFLLFKGCVNGMKIAIQVLPHKTRVMSALTASLLYFDAHNILWRELLHPVEINIFYRVKFCSEDLVTYEHGIPVSLHIGLKRLDISLTEIALDILLYVIGKLNFAGPFAVKSSSILANYCKVENHTEVNLHCHYDDSQDARVGRKQSAFFFLRNLADQSLEASYVSVKLEIFGSLSTSAVKLPLSGNQTFAWRTRIMSVQDSQTYPGPFIVFDIAKNVEEGLSIVVSPLLRIHNETAFSLELRFQRPRQAETESASMFLESRDTIDDCLAAFDAIKLSGPIKKALMSVSIGNFLFSFRPDKKGELSSLKNDYSIDWSDNIKGGKAVRLSGIIEKLNYKVRRVFTAESSNYSFSIACCSVRSGEACVANLHFLVGSIVRQIPVLKPSVEADARDSMVALQEQKELFLLPTVRVHNLLQLDVHVLLTESDVRSMEDPYNIGNQATVPCGSTAELYANPGTICFTVTLIILNTSCKPVKSEDWLKKLNKQRDGIQFLDVDLEFGGGKYFASLRLNRGDKGTLEAVIYTSYTLKNDTEYSLLCFTPSQNPPSRDEIEKHGSYMPPYLGCFMPPKSIRSWFMKSNKLCLKLLDQEASESILDLDSLSGLAEISLAKDAGLGFKHLVKLGVSLGPLQSKMTFPLQVVSMVPRYIVSNDSDEKIYVKQCYLEDNMDAISIASKQRMSLLLMDVAGKRRQLSAFDKLLRKHRVAVDDSSMLIQFRIDFPGSDWSGPICVAALGRFYLKFKRSSEPFLHQSDSSKNIEKRDWEFAAVHVVEEASSFVLHFTRISDNNLPYRIENQLSEAFIEYYQKDTFEPMTLLPGGSVGYVWDDSTRPHKLVVRINGADALREINLDKLRGWRPFLGARNLRDVAYHLHLDSNIGNQNLIDKGRKFGLDLSKIGYEVYADGPTRVLRICGFPGSSLHGGTISESNIKLQLRVSSFTIQLLGRRKENLMKKEDRRDSLIYSPIMVGKLENTCLDSIFGEQRKYNRFRIKLISVDQKWDGAPFASTLRMHQMPGPYSQNDILVVVFVLDSNGSNVKKFKYSSILLQPITIKLDEETLMKIVPFWRTSLSQSTQSQQYYFDHFEIHPVKIIATFLPAESYSSYDSTQEALRSLLHSVIKMPTIENMVVELNGVLVTHALVTIRELLIKCAQHYSWYSMRAIYIAKGSTLLPPSFASVFDDLASSSLDVFFDPSNNLLNIRGLTVGSFKLISRCIKDKGLSGTKRYFGDLGKTLKMAGSNILFAAVTEISDSVLKGAESSGFNGMVIGFHHGILKLAMEPTLLRSAFLEGGPDRKIWLDRSPGVDELYIEGYLQAMLDTVYKQEYLRVRVIDNQVILKNLPPNSSLIDEIMDRVKDFLVSKALLKGDTSRSSRPLRHLRGENDWRIGPTIRTLCEHLFVSFAIRTLRKQTDTALAKIKEKGKWKVPVEDSTSLDSSKEVGRKKQLVVWRWGIGRFAFSAILAYIDGRLCRGIPNPVARRIVSGFLLSFLDRKEERG